jgi:hypothetical protein
MTTITNYNNGYRMKFSNPGTRGFSVFAADLTEMKIALDHYYGKPIHAANSCPLCRRRDEKQRKGA